MLDIENIISKNSIVIFSKPGCKYCDKSYELLQDKNILFYKCDLGNYMNDLDFDDIYDKLIKISNNAKSFPIIFIDKKYIGGFNELKKYINELEIATSFQQNLEF
jgi:glutaredoxin